MNSATLCLAAGLALMGGPDRNFASIHEVDFQNFTYRVWGDREVEARGGRSTLAKDADPADPVIDLIDVAYGDLTGDGRDEAAVVVWTNGGGTGSFSEGFLYTLRDGTAECLARFEGGDRAVNGIWAVSISNGRLVVERESGPGPAHTEQIVTTWYRWDGHTLRPVKTAKRKWDGEYPPSWKKRSK